MTLRRPITTKQLKELKEKIKPLIPGFDTLAQHVVITDPQANILYMNKAAEETTGYQLKDALGKNPGDLWGGNMPDEFYTEMWNALKKTRRPFMGEVRNTQKNGTAYWQELLISPVSDAQGRIQFFIAIEPNITQRKKSQEFLETLTGQITRAKHFSQAIRETTKLICQFTDWEYGEVWVVDQIKKVLRQDFFWTSKPKKIHQFVQVSKKINFALGEGLPGRTWLRKKPEWVKDVSTQPKQLFWRVPEAQAVGLKGAFAQPLVVNNTVVAILVFFLSQARSKDEDLIRFVQSGIQKLEFLFQQKFLEEHLNILQRGIEASKDAILVATEAGTILYVNSAWEKLVEQPRSNVLGENIQIVWDHGMPKSFFDQMWNTVLVKQKPFTQEVHVASQGKQKLWQEVHVSPVKDETGKVKFLIAIASDTSKHKAKDKFREEFISIVGHQLKNPLTSTRWTLELLLDQKKIDRSQKKDLEILYNQNQNILNLVGDLLILSRVEKAQVDIARVDLTKEIKTIVAIAKNNHPSVKITFTPTHQPVELSINKTLALQVFYNIIMNAIEYSNQKTGKVAIQLKVTGKRCIFSCQDNGIGIPKKEQSRVFTQFFRGSNAVELKQGGTGLGLYIVKLVADSLGWKVSFTSAEGKGTTFTVNFPLR